MRVNAYMAIVVLVCSLGGLLLALGLTWAYADIDRDIETYGARAVLATDLGRLEEDLSQWAVTSDLVYGSGDTYLIDGAIRRGDSIRNTINRIVADPVAKGYAILLGEVRDMVVANEARLGAANELDSENRMAGLSRFLEEWDSQASVVFPRLLEDRQALESDIETRRLQARDHRERLWYISTIAVLMYVLVVGLVWRWAVVTTARPLLRLAKEAESALAESRPLRTHGVGPRETQQLASSLQAFAGNLEETVRERTRDVHGLIGLRDALFDAVPFPVFHRDVADRFLECNRACESFFGVKQADLVGQTTSGLPESLRVLLEHQDISTSHGGTRECVVQNASGSERVVLYTETIVGGADEGSGVVSVLVDITFRVRAGRRAQQLHTLRTIESETVAWILERRDFPEVIQHTLERIGTCLDVAATTLGVQRNVVMEHIMEGRRQWRRSAGDPDRLPLMADIAGMATLRQKMLDRGEPVILEPKDLRDDPDPEIRQLYESGIRTFVILPILVEGGFIGTITIDDVEVRDWHEDQLIALMSIAQGLGRSVERIRAEIHSNEYGRRQRAMLRELDHRVKNNLAIILSMADQTARETDSIEVFQEAFSGRINSMARAHELLAASQWSGADLRQALQIVLAANRGAGRTTIEGPTVVLPPEVSTSTCLVLNELATNALKHGSLSVPDGRIEVSWLLEGDDLILTWWERGGPVPELPFATGMGTRLIDGFINYQLGGAVEMAIADGGLQYRFTIPLAELDAAGV
ncbi:MAG: PAS domain S-box protein [Phycisphaerales bacterium]|nr:PAS domain S-box protein [Phycisphaerales bacterium]